MGNVIGHGFMSCDVMSLRRGRLFDLRGGSGRLGTVTLVLALLNFGLDVKKDVRNPLLVFSTKLLDILCNAIVGSRSRTSL